MRGKELKDSMRSSFLDYFSENSHSKVDPYPVIARWRDDIHLTIASIADFQPHVTSGQVPPPANPLCICLLYTSPSPRDATLSRMPSSA